MVPDGSFVAYLVDEVHMDPKVYAAPEEFNPGRFLSGGADGKGEGKGAHEFVGWGSGRHPCREFSLHTSPCFSCVLFSLYLHSRFDPRFSALPL